MARSKKRRRFTGASTGDDSIRSRARPRASSKGVASSARNSVRLDFEARENLYHPLVGLAHPHRDAQVIREADGGAVAHHQSSAQKPIAGHGTVANLD